MRKRQDGEVILSLLLKMMIYVGAPTPFILIGFDNECDSAERLLKSPSLESYVIYISMILSLYKDDFWISPEKNTEFLR